MTDYSENENYSNMDEHHEENDEEDGIVEYLEIDSEVMETLQDPNDYFTEVNNSQGQIYVQQNAAVNTQQLSLVIQNPNNEYSSLKQISSQQFDNHNGVTNVLWSNNIINSNDKTIVSVEDSCKPINGSNSSKKSQRKRKAKNNNSTNNSKYTKYINEKNTVMAKEQTQSESDSLDLFFQSMAQTVSHLPSRIQAKIKMEICKVISMAEIKYCSQETIMQGNLTEDCEAEN